MRRSKISPGAVLLVVFTARANAQMSSPGTSLDATPQSQSSSSSRRTARHVRVAEEDPAEVSELAQAEAEIGKQDYAAAEPLLRKLVEHDPKNYEGWFDLGFVENAVGNAQASLGAYRQSVAAKPGVFESNLNLGLQLAKTGQPEAEKYLREATRLKPASHAAEGQYRAWLGLGDVLAKSKPEEAMSAYRMAASAQPKEAEPHLAIGALLEAKHQSGDAEEEYKKALTISRGSSDAAIALANLYMRGRRFPEAEKYLGTVLAEQPDSAAAEIQLGRVLAAEGKYNEAIAAMTAGVKLDPQDEGAQRDLADLYSTAGKNDQAEASYRGLIIAHPKEAELHRGLGQALLRQKKFKDAQQEFQVTVNLKPDFGEAYGDLAFTAGENKDYQLALRALDARAGLLPEIPITYFLRASAYDHLRDLKAAAVNYHLFLDLGKGKYPDQEWQAKHRLIAIEPKK